MLKVVLATIVLAFPATHMAKTIHVPGEQPTVQDGLNVANAGDTVLVAAGEYYVGSLFWPAQNGINLIGEGAETTVLRGNEWQCVLYMADAVEIDSTTFLSRMTLRKGGDAGIILFGVSPVIAECSFDSTIAGPGVYAVEGSRALLKNCEISHNSGSGLRVLNSGPGFSLISCKINGKTEAFGYIDRHLAEQN